MSYSKKIIDHFLHPKHLGIWTSAEQAAVPEGEKIVQAEAGQVARGSVLRLALKIRVADEQILDARFQNIGIELPIASASYFCSIIIGKSLSDAAKITAEDLHRDLEGLPEIQNRQPVLVLDAMESITLTLHPRPPEQPLCYCNNIPASALEKKIRQLDLKTIDDVMYATRAGGGCQGCHPEIEDLLKKVSADPSCATGGLPTSASTERILDLERSFVAEKNLVIENLSGDRIGGQATSGTQQLAWPAMSHAERLARLQSVLEKDLRPMIRNDGGDIQLLELDGDIVRITLHGNCVNCHSSTSTLKLGVERRLREVVWPTLEVHSS